MRVVSRPPSSPSSSQCVDRRASDGGAVPSPPRFLRRGGAFGERPCFARAAHNHARSSARKRPGLFLSFLYAWHASSAARGLNVPSERRRRVRGSRPRSVVAPRTATAAVTAARRSRTTCGSARRFAAFSRRNATITEAVFTQWRQCATSIARWTISEAVFERKASAVITR